MASKQTREVNIIPISTPVPTPGTKALRSCVFELRSQHCGAAVKLKAIWLQGSCLISLNMAVMEPKRTTTQPNPTQPNPTQCSATQYNPTQHDWTQHNLTQTKSTQANTTQCNPTHPSLTQHNTTQFTTQPKATVHPTQHNRTQPNVRPCCLEDRRQLSPLHRGRHLHPSVFQFPLDLLLLGC